MTKKHKPLAGTDGEHLSASTWYLNVLDSELEAGNRDVQSSQCRNAFFHTQQAAQALGRVMAHGLGRGGQEHTLRLKQHVKQLQQLEDALLNKCLCGK